MIDVIRSEWIKQSTVTVTWVLVSVAAIFPTGIALLTAGFTNDFLDGEELASVIAGTSVVSAMLLGVLGTLAVTGEFSHNTIRPTFAAMPDRIRPLLAKPIVNVALSVITIAAVILVGWVAGAAVADGTQELGQGDAQAALIGTVFLTIGLTILGFAIGLLVRNSAGSICLLLLWPLVAEGLIAGLMSVADKEGWQRWLPYVAGINMTSVGDSSDALDRVPGGLYFFAWVFVLLALGVVKTKRRDA